MQLSSLNSIIDLLFSLLFILFYIIKYLYFLKLSYIYFIILLYNVRYIVCCSWIDIWKNVV